MTDMVISTKGITRWIQNDAIVQLLIEEGIITLEKFFTKLKQVQAQYEAKQ